jgi:hypothetical protein
MLHKEKKEKRRKKNNFSMNNFQNRGQNDDFHLTLEKLEKNCQKLDTLAQKLLIQ